MCVWLCVYVCVCVSWFVTLWGSDQIWRLNWGMMRWRFPPFLLFCLSFFLKDRLHSILFPVKKKEQADTWIMWRYLQCVCVCVCLCERETEREEEWIRGLLGQLQTVQRVCCWWIRWQRAAALRLPAALLLHNVCFLLNYSSPAAWPALHADFCGGETRESHI